MSRSSTPLGRLGAAVGYVVLGAVVTAAVALGVLSLGRWLQRPVYDLLYLRVGPSEATVAAILTQFLAAVAVALSLATLAGDALRTGAENRAAVARAAAVLIAAVPVFLALSALGLAAFPTALAVLAVVLVAVPVRLRIRDRVQSDTVLAFLGGVPVVILLLALAGFGIGWGWGYVVTASEVPAPADGAASFDEAPEFGADLLESGDCDEVSGQRTCLLELRGYEREIEAVGFLAGHDVRCRYEGAPARGPPDSVVVRWEERYYRVTCSPHGD